MPAVSTRERAVIEAAKLSQRLGFTNISVQQVAEKLKVKQPSLYQHFKSKDALGHELIKYFGGGFELWCATVESFEPQAQIRAFFALARRFCESGRMCGFAALLADYNALSKSMRRALDRMFEAQRQWLERMIARGQAAGAFRADVTAKKLSEDVLSSYIGSQMLARISDRATYVENVMELTIERLLNAKKKGR